MLKGGGGGLDAPWFESSGGDLGRGACLRRLRVLGKERPSSCLPQSLGRRKARLRDQGHSLWPGLPDLQVHKEITKTALTSQWSVHGQEGPPRSPENRWLR